MRSRGSDQSNLGEVLVPMCPALSNWTELITHSTLSSNRGRNFGLDSSGGGIANTRGIVTVSNSTLSLVLSTLTLNQAANGGGLFIESGFVSIQDTLIALNLVFPDGINPDVVGSFTSDGDELIGAQMQKQSKL